MAMLMICILGGLLILPLATCLTQQDQSSHGHLIDATWLDSSEKFKLVARWGAQL
ncbi:MAG: hypothetical protein RQ754_12555 [Desulfuromonadales bacterium]|nr:hypothetical protein [Desulfuromonadales bacterium]